MKEHWLHFATVFSGFFAIMNPLANTPVFLGLTADDDPQTRRAVARRSLGLAFLIVAVFSLMGKLIFDLFGLTMPALRIAGGILVFKIGFDMLHGESSRSHTLAPEDADGAGARLGVAVSPLAVPLLAGPGTIATAMSFSAGNTYIPILGTIIAFGILCAVTYVAFISGERILALVGESTLKIITRLMGLILAVIGVQMVIQGIQEGFGLAS